MTPLDANGGEIKSWYHATANHPGRFPALDRDRNTDVAIVGGGFTGVSAALALAEAGVNVVLIEAHQIGFGASGRNGGQVGSGQRVDQMTLEAQYGFDLAKVFWDIAESSKDEVKRLIKTHAIDASWRSGILNIARRQKTVAYLQQYAEHLNRAYDYPAEMLSRQDAVDAVGTSEVRGGLLDPFGGHIHPLRFLYGLASAARAKGVTIFENTRATDISTGTVRTSRATIKTDKILIATNGYGGELNRDVAARVLPINSFVGVTEPLAEPPFERDFAVADDRFVVNYWRIVDSNRLLFGGGESYGLRFPKEIAAKVRKPLSELYPGLSKARLEFAWGGTLGITTSRLPLFRELAPGVLTVAGYSGHGIALATLGGRIAAEHILGSPERFDHMAHLDVPPVPGGHLVRRALVPLAMHYYAIRDRLGF